MSAMTTSSAGGSGWNTEHRLGLAGIGATAVAFVLTSLRLPSEALIGLFAFGVALMLPATALLGRLRPRRLRGTAGHRTENQDRALMAAEQCRQLAQAILSLLDEHAGGARSAETVLIYQRDYRTWALAVFAEVVALDAMSASGRQPLEGRDIVHIRLLPMLFQSAAERLEELARQHP
jgi:hypothetical protein